MEADPASWVWGNPWAGGPGFDKKADRARHEDQGSKRHSSGLCIRFCLHVLALFVFLSLLPSVMAWEDRLSGNLADSFPYLITNECGLCLQDCDGFRSKNFGEREKKYLQASQAILK